MTKFPAAIDDAASLPVCVHGVANTMNMGGGLTHTELHNATNDAIKALEAKVGVDGSSDPASIDHRLATLEAALAAVEMIPSGLIAMWAGTVQTIPAGWKLCDGTLGTPDLRDKFVKGAANAANAGATGGGSYTPAGTVSAPVFTGNAATTSAVSAGTPTGTISSPTFTGDSVTTSAVSAGTPAGTNSAPGFTGTTWTAPAIAWPAGVPVISGTAVADHASHTHSVTSNVSVAAHTFTQPTIAWPAGVPTAANESAHTHTYTQVPNHLHPDTATLTVQGGTTAATTGTHVMTSTAVGGSARAVTTGDGIAITAVNPTGGVATATTAAGSAHTHTISWPAGVPTSTGGAVDAHAVTNAAVTSAGPSATLTHAVTQGTAAWPLGVPTIGAYTPAGSVAAPTFTGSALGTHTHTVTATGTISAPAFTGAALGAHSHTATASGTNSSPTFTGTPATVEPAYYTVLFIQKV